MRTRALAAAAAVALAALAAAPAAVAQPANAKSLTFLKSGPDYSSFLSDEAPTWEGRQATYWLFLAWSAPDPDSSTGVTYVGAWALSKVDCDARTSWATEMVSIDVNLAPAGRMPLSAAPAAINPTSAGERLRLHICEGRPLGGNAVRAANLEEAVRLSQSGTLR